MYIGWSTQRCCHAYVVHTHMSELCDSGSIVVEIYTITVLLMRARLVSTIKIECVPTTVLPEVLYTYYVGCLHIKILKVY